MNASQQQTEKPKPWQARQGDLLLELVEQLPENLTCVPPSGRRLILAEGEATGHHHSVAVGSSRLFASPNGELFLLVKEGGALLEHEEHSAIVLPKGIVQVRRQREYSPGEVRNVCD